MQLTKESQDKINKAAAAMAATEAKIISDSMTDIYPIFLDEGIGKDKILGSLGKPDLFRRKISEEFSKEYKKQMFTQKGSMCVDDLVKDLGNGKYEVTTTKKFVPWLKDIPRRETTEISTILSDKSRIFTNPKLIAKDLQSHFSGTKHNAITASRTEATKIQYEANMESRRAKGQKYVRYITAGDSNVRPWHEERNNLVYEIGTEPPIGSFNCRCTYVDATYAVEILGEEVQPNGTTTIGEEQLINKITGQSVLKNIGAYDKQYDNTITPMYTDLTNYRVKLINANKEYEKLSKDWQKGIITIDEASEKQAVLYRTTIKPTSEKIKEIKNNININLNIINNEMHKTHLYNKNKSNFVYNLSGAKAVEKESGKSLDDALLFINNIISSNNVSKPITIKSLKKNGRAYYDPKSMSLHVPSNTGARDIIHEFGHLLEYSDNKIHTAALNFYKKRTANEKLISLRKATGNKRYSSKEVTKVDKFSDPYIGKYYIESNGAQSATELISMGMEKLYSDPIKFSREDPEYFEWIIDVINGNI